MCCGCGGCEGGFFVLLSYRLCYFVLLRAGFLLGGCLVCVWRHLYGRWFRGLIVIFVIVDTFTV